MHWQKSELNAENIGQFVSVPGGQVQVCVPQFQIAQPGQPWLMLHSHVHELVFHVSSQLHPPSLAQTQLQPVSSICPGPQAGGFGELQPGPGLPYPWVHSQ